MPPKTAARSVSHWLFACLLLLITPFASGATTTYTTLDIPTLNSDIRTWGKGYTYSPLFPSNQTFSGVPFSLQLDKAGNNAFGGTKIVNLSYAGSQQVTSIEINVGIYGVTNVYTLINTAWGKANATVGSISFHGSAGTIYTVQLVEGYNVRDHLYGSYINTITAPYVTQSVFGFNSPGYAHLDMQDFALPFSFQNQTLTSIVFSSTGGRSGNPVLVGATVGVKTAPVCTLSANPTTITAGGSATLTATCNPAATSYTWTGGACASVTTSTCAANPSNTTTYTLKGSNTYGSSAETSATVYVCDAPPAVDVAGLTLTGDASNEKFSGSLGNDTIDGAGGVNTVIYGCKRANFTLQQTTTGWVVSSVAEGFDKLSNIQRLQFDDETLALDISGNAGQAYRVYQAAFNRTPDSGGLKYWIEQMDKGMGLQEVAARFVDSDEFRSLYGTNPTNASFLTKLYNNVLHRQPEQGGYDWWLDELNSGRRSQTKALADFSESDENKTGVLPAIQNGIELPN